jgi:hypothetical protein
MHIRPIMKNPSIGILVRIPYDKIELKAQVTTICRLPAQSTNRSCAFRQIQLQSIPVRSSVSVCTALNEWLGYRAIFQSCESCKPRQ